MEMFVIRLDKYATLFCYIWLLPLIANYVTIVTNCNVLVEKMIGINTFGDSTNK